jgi:hypothetical protein
LPGITIAATSILTCRPWSALDHFLIVKKEIMRVATFSRHFMLPVIAGLSLFVFACNKDDDNDTSATRFVEYPLTAVGNSGVNGKVTISENTDSSFNVLVVIDKSVKDTVHLLHLNHGSVSNPSPGDIIVQLNSITGTGGPASSTTNGIKRVKTSYDAMITFTYDSITHYNGHINVQYSAGRSDSLIAQGNIGSNKQ